MLLQYVDKEIAALDIAAREAAPLSEQISHSNKNYKDLEQLRDELSVKRSKIVRDLEKVDLEADEVKRALDEEVAHRKEVLRYHQRD